MLKHPFGPFRAKWDCPLFPREHIHVFRIDLFWRWPMSGELAAAGRIRQTGRSAHPANGQRGRQPHSRANFLDLVGDTLDTCGARIDEGLPNVREAHNAVEEQRALLATQLAGKMQAELLANRRQWENRLLGQAASRGGFSPFAFVLRAYQGSAAFSPARCCTVPARPRIWPCGGRSRASAPGGGIANRRPNAASATPPAGSPPNCEKPR